MTEVVMEEQKTVESNEDLQKDVKVEAENQEQQEIKNNQNILDSAKKWSNQIQDVVSGGITAAFQTQDEIEEKLGKLVGIDYTLGKESRKWAYEFLNKGFHRTKDTAQMISHQSLEKFDTILSQLSIPTKKEVEAISRKVDEISLKVEELSKKIDKLA